MNYKADQIAQGSSAAVYYYNESQKSWVYLGGTMNADGTVTVNVNHFTKFAVFNYELTALLDLAGHWVKPYTDRLIGMNVVQGFEDRKFHPEDTLTRGQFAKMVAEAFKLPTSTVSTSFEDDSKIPSWAKASVAAAVKAGFINGYDENGKTLFEADQTITRAEMSVIMARALSANGNKSETVQNQFRDATSMPAWAQASVNTAVSSGILNGYEDQTFRPSLAATRAEASVMIYKLLEALNI
ncbi:S-layer homology domain-containing protein [Paenibacillus alginolyticus]|uniref:S-layer homology domain-containing protein n=1 Tax=Paenibacillus alginolyticus TaxID=59839 RepID=UPI001FE2CDA2|nr:S-layer homology domain-containing protein [Paenibacillus frigoriresistens]